MKNDLAIGRALRIVSRYLLFFMVVAFLVSCTTMLFVSILADTVGLSLDGENLSSAAKITFVNVLLLSLLFTVIDALRRKFTVERVRKNISEAMARIAEGNFDVRVQPLGSFMIDENLTVIMDCFNQMSEKLGTVETLRTDFVSNVSHEMKTPLAVMQNYAALLKAHDLSEEKRLEYAGGISDAARRLSAMMTNVLRLSRLENGEIGTSRELYDLGEQLAECLLQYESVWEKKRIDLIVDLEEDVPVFTDRELLSLVWSNLFSNAFKFTPEGGTVEISLRKKGEKALVSVRDTGCGMSLETGARIFEKFYQGDTSHATEGNGLGLALVKRAVDRIGGEIAVESLYGKGSTFTVTLRR